MNKVGLSYKGYTPKEGETYKYVYTLEIPAVPSETVYKNDCLTLSHTANYTGAVSINDKAVLNVADGEVTEENSFLAATLKGKDVYYYGDEPAAADVELTDVAQSLGIIKVDAIYLADKNGTRVDLSKMSYGEYYLTADLIIDNNDDGDFIDNNDQAISLKRKVNYAPRPMSENEYYLKGADDQLTKLAVKYAKAKAAETDSGSGSGTGIPVGISGGTPVETPISNTEPELDLDDLQDKATGEYKYPVVVVPENTYTYNSKDQKPEIVVKNPSLGKTTENEQGTALVIKTETAAGEYTSAVTAHKDAGTYSEKITAVPDVKDEGNNVTKQANYTGDVTVVWTIKKAKANITVAAKNNIVYDGKNLDGDDFDVTAKEATPDGLTKEFLETIGKKDSGTTFDVTAAIGTVYFENKYETTDANGITVKYNENTSNNNGKVIGGNIVVSPSSKTSDDKDITSHKLTIRIDNDDQNIQRIVNGSKIDTLTTTFQELDFSSNYTLTYDSQKGTLTISTNTYSAKEGYKLYIERIEGGINGSGSLDGDDPVFGETIYIVIKAVPTSGLADGVSNIKDANVEGEVKKANVTIKSKNFEDIVYKQKLDDNGGVIADQDKSLTAKIKPRPVTITPKNIDNKPFVYGTFVANNDDGYFNCSYFNC